MLWLRCWWTRFIDWVQPIEEPKHVWHPDDEVLCLDCDHILRRRVRNQAARVTGWCSVCLDCGALFLDMTVVKTDPLSGR